MAPIFKLASTFTPGIFYGYLIFLHQAKVWLILSMQSEFQTSTSINVHMAPISKLASTFTPCYPLWILIFLRSG